MRTSHLSESGRGHGSAVVVPTDDPSPGDDDTLEPYGVSGRAGDGRSRGENHTFGGSGRQHGPGGNDTDADAPLAADEEGGAVERKRDAPHMSALPPPSNLSQKPRALTLSSEVGNHAPVTCATNGPHLSSRTRTM